MDTTAALLDSWDRQARIVNAVATRVTESNKNVKPSPDGWPLYEHLAHIQLVRKFWLRELDAERSKSLVDLYNGGWSDPIDDLAMIKKALEDSAIAVGETVQKALALMPDGGSIILNASIVASKGLPEWSVYSATKAAVRSFARTWTTDLKDRRIRVNAVSPGYIDTPGLNGLLAASGAAEQRRKTISNAVPLGRFGTPDEIAKAVVFLASDDSSYVTGAELFVDAGVAQV